jgi:hypothetical protein
MHESTERIENTTTLPMEVICEPWGQVFTLQPGEWLRFEAQSESEGQLDVEREADTVCIYGWPGCTMRIYNADGLVVDYNIPFPVLPPGLSVKGFVNAIFRGIPPDSGTKGEEK